MGIRRWKSGDRRDLDSDKSRNCRDFDSRLYNDCPDKNLITNGNQECGRRSAMAQAHVVLHAKRSRDDMTEVDSQSKQSVTIQGDGLWPGSEMTFPSERLAFSGQGGHFSRITIVPQNFDWPRGRLLKN
jgi:hypothetical protein